MTPALEAAQRLLSLAQADRDAFLWLIQGPGLRPATVMFSAHQACEKALKAVMIARGLVPGRTHNLLALTAELNENGVPTPFTPDQMAVLNPYAVTFRYADEEISLITPAQARTLVIDLLEWANEALARLTA
jgi:HEPN domain-containing protein